MYIYNPKTDKAPFGAVRTGELIYLTLKVISDKKPDSVNLILRKETDGTRKYPFSFEKDEDGLVYSCVFAVKQFGLYFYRFEVTYGDVKTYIGRNDDCDADEYSCAEWQLTVYDRGFVAPKKWGADIIYHIFVDRFNRSGDLIPIDYGTEHQWNDEITVAGADGVYHADDFYGGNLRGIIEKLDYLNDLGVTIIYLSPIFSSHSNHRYDTSDYMQIDKLIGTEDDFAELVGKARIRGMRIMLDGVFNHSGSDSVYFNKNGYFPSFGAYQGSASPYRDWYSFNNDGTYECWWGIDCVPTFNKKSKSLVKYMFGENGVIAKWSHYDIDWRLDVVDELSPEFLDKLRQRVKIENPSSTVLGEVWEDASKKYSYGTLRTYFTRGDLDGVMNYVFRNAILDYAKGGPAINFVRAVSELIENYPKQCMDCCMTMLGSHDTVRVIDDLAGVNVEGWSQQRQLDYKLSAQQRRTATDRLFVAATLEYTLPGIPSIYYGDEIGLEGGKDPTNRRPYPWGKENHAILNFYKQLGIMRCSLASALSGDTKLYCYNDLLVYERGDENYNFMVVANTSGRAQSMPLNGTYLSAITKEEFDGSIFLPDISAFVLIKK